LRKRDGHSVPFRRRFTTSQIPESYQNVHRSHRVC
jgi:hypothetical protein